MKRRQVWRYSCEFCKKSGCAANHIRRHEASCCSNPNRVCRMCAVVGGVQEPTALLARALLTRGLDGLRNAAGGCPACMLAGIIASGVQCDGELRVEFDFDAEKRSMWQQHNEALAALTDYILEGKGAP